MLNEGCYCGLNTYRMRPAWDEIPRVRHDMGEKSVYERGKAKLWAWHAQCARRREREASERRAADAAETLEWARERAERLAREDSAFAVRLMLARADLDAVRSATARPQKAKGAAE